MHTNEIDIKEVGIQTISAHNQKTPSSFPLNGKHRTNRNIAMYNKFLFIVDLFK